MFPSFTGNSRRPRQVNLSGRNPNPFASSGASKGQLAALTSAQQNRAQRQKERERQLAAKVLQNAWRGYSCREKLRRQLRKEWDAYETRTEQSREVKDDNIVLYRSEAESLLQVRRLIQYISPTDGEDKKRLLRWFSRHQEGIQQSYISISETSWNSTYLRIQKLVLSILNKHNLTEEPVLGSKLLAVLLFTAECAPQRTSANSQYYYHTLSSTAASISSEILPESVTKTFLQLLILPLSVLDGDTLQVYENFAIEFLTTPALHMNLDAFHGLEFIAEHLNYRILERALAGRLNNAHKPWSDELRGAEADLWLLAYFIYIQNYTFRCRISRYSFSTDYVSVVSTLLPSVAAHYDFSPFPYLPVRQQAQTRRIAITDIDVFLQDQISSLVKEESIRNLLSGFGASILANVQELSEDDKSRANKYARYALNLLQIFPQRGDDIRMWLYLGSGSSRDNNGENCPISALRFFWKAARETSVFRDISRDARLAITVLRGLFKVDQVSETEVDTAVTSHATKLEDKWSLIAIFMELYSFVLRIMDDDEFFSPLTNMVAPSSTSTATRSNALPLEEVRELSTFLKHLGFTMYFNGPEIVTNSESCVESAGIKQAFTSLNSSLESLKASRAGHQIDSTMILSIGFSMNYLKRLVTGLLRVIYERDSRRKFTSKDHWLMKSRLDMNGFIPAVVYEEEKSHQLQELDDDNDDDESSFPEEEISVIGAGRIERTRGTERLKRQQNRVIRKRDTELVTPRLEILQNMPFLISFHTRVQIFREFVHQDQHKRRNGVIDPDMWRWSLIDLPNHRERVEKHQAKIRRGHEFDDAYKQLFQLGDGLKEPTYITFVDQFGGVEAGIDGGGVTKEFLTSVTNQAFEPVEGLNPFVTNDKHLLYPNPVALSEYQERLRQVGMKDDSPDFRLHVVELLQKYEFLGRILGKCLYEGILVDLNFAPFFLLKWALTGGTGSAPKESNYRANLNDLRDLDEALYQGLLQLKNYQGNVEDFSLNFTVTDTITVDYNTRKTKNITQELKASGAEIPVTNANRLFYVSYVSRYRLQTQPYLQTSAFLKGLSSIIQPSWLAMFNQSELQTLISGTSSTIDLKDLRRHTEYGGVYVIGDDRQEHPSVILFWKVMDSLSDDEQRAVLKFVTSTPRAPLLGFGSLNPKFTIRDAGDDEDRLPSTSTCVNLLKLPRYTNETVLKEKILYSAFSGAGFDLS